MPIDIDFARVSRHFRSTCDKDHRCCSSSSVSLRNVSASRKVAMTKCHYAGSLPSASAEARWSIQENRPVADKRTKVTVDTGSFEVYREHGRRLYIAARLLHYTYTTWVSSITLAKTRGAMRIQTLEASMPYTSPLVFALLSGRNNAGPLTWMSPSSYLRYSLCYVS